MDAWVGAQLLSAWLEPWVKQPWVGGEGASSSWAEDAYTGLSEFSVFSERFLYIGFIIGAGLP